MKRKRKKLVGIAMAMSVLLLAMVPLQAADIDLDDETSNSGEMTVQGTVSEKTPASPTYLIKIPSLVDFGKITIPNADMDSFKDLPFDITLVESANIPNGSGICVLVSDADTSIGTDSTKPTNRFRMKKADTGNTLDYSVCLTDGQGNITTDLFTNGTWYDNGFLYGVFNNSAEPGSVMPGMLRLNQRQLFEKTPANVKGQYAGKLRFYTTVKSIADVQQ